MYEVLVKACIQQSLHIQTELVILRICVISMQYFKLYAVRQYITFIHAYTCNTYCNLNQTGA